MKSLLLACVAMSCFCVACTREKPSLTDAELLAQMQKVRAQLKVDSTDIPGDWHFQFQSVRAYRMNWDDQYSWDPILSGDDMNDTLVPLDGILLSDVQVQRLQEAVTGAHPDRGVGLCFYPHHAFLFFDEGGEIVGDINVCLLCSSFKGEPKGFSKYWDLAAVAELLHEFGMPLQNADWER